MGIRFGTASGRYLSRSANLPNGSGCTVWGFVTPNTLLSASQCVTTLINTVASRAIALYMNSSNQLLMANPDAADAILLTMIAGHTYFAAVTMNGGASGTATAYVRDITAAATSLTSGSSAYSSAITPNAWRVGEDGFGSICDATHDGWGATNNVLTSAQLLAQSMCRRPLFRSANDLGWWPMHDTSSVANAAKDYSGAARDFSVNGTPTINANAAIRMQRNGCRA